MSHVSPELKIWNGQVWEQKDFPCYRIVVLMLSHIDGVLMFARASWHNAEPPLVMTEENGTWMYSDDELFEMLKSRHYTLVGCAQSGALLDCEHREKNLTIPVDSPSEGV
ncbi:MAG: hypothetical protein K1Y02_26010 [Candidatus Hydrogenedentes bacterium]|nr:hypothetical protein [Candidatus Hydrogenedentota bacterium]